MRHILRPLATPAPARGSRIWLALIGALCVSCLLSSPSTQAQQFGRIDDTQSNVAYFYHAQPGEATVQVSVWGTIPRPGIYEVSDSTDLDKLLTMAGGAPVSAREENRDPATIMVRVYRPGENAAAEGDSDRTLLFESNLNKMLNGTASYPTFRDDDIVVVETIRPRQRFTWREAISVLSSIGTLTLLGLRLFGRR